MVDLTSIMHTAQRGQAIDILADQFSLTFDQANEAVAALLPAFSAGLKNQAAGASALGQFIGHLSDEHNQAAFRNAEAAQSDEAQMAGSQALDHLFGGQRAIGAVAQRAADETGVSPELLQQMMPQIASILLGGLMIEAQRAGFAEDLRQLGQQAPAGGLGAAGSTPPPGAAAGFAGVFGGLVGSLFGSRSQAAVDYAPPATAAAQNALAALGAFFEHGSQPPSELEQDFQSLLANS